MGGILRRVSPNDNDSASVFDRAADRVCKRCPLNTSCWQRDYVSTYNALNDALPAMLERGRGEGGDFPAYFSNRCMKFPELLTAVNEELAALLYRRQYQNRLKENRAAVCRQYGELAEVLGAAAAELSRELTPDPLGERKLRARRKSRPDGGNCGSGGSRGAGEENRVRRGGRSGFRVNVIPKTRPARCTEPLTFDF